VYTVRKSGGCVQGVHTYIHRGTVKDAGVHKVPLYSRVTACAA